MSKYRCHYKHGSKTIVNSLTHSTLPTRLALRVANSHNPHRNEHQLPPFRLLTAREAWRSHSGPYSALLLKSSPAHSSRVPTMRSTLGDRIDGFCCHFRSQLHCSGVAFLRHLYTWHTQPHQSFYQAQRTWTLQQAQRTNTDAQMMVGQNQLLYVSTQHQHTTRKPYKQMHTQKTVQTWYLLSPSSKC